MSCNQSLTGRQWLQILQNKGVASKFLFLNRLAPAGVYPGGACFVFLYCFKYSGLRVTKMHFGEKVYSVCLFVSWRIFGWLRDLSCNFLVENAKNKCKCNKP